MQSPLQNSRNQNRPIQSTAPNGVVSLQNNSLATLTVKELSAMLENKQIEIRKDLGDGFSLYWLTSGPLNVFKSEVETSLSEIKDFLSDFCIAPVDQKAITSAYLFIVVEKLLSDPFNGVTPFLRDFILNNYFKKDLFSKFNTIESINQFLSFMPRQQIVRAPQQFLKPKAKDIKKSTTFTRFGVAAAAAAAIGLAAYVANNNFNKVESEQAVLLQLDSQSNTLHLADEEEPLASLPELAPEDLELIEDENVCLDPSNAKPIQQNVSVYLDPEPSTSQPPETNTKDLDRDDVKFQDFVDLLAPSPQPSYLEFDYSTVGQIPNQLPTFTTDTFIQDGQPVNTVYMPLPDIIYDPELSTVQFQVNTLRDPLVVRELIENNGEFVARRTDQRLAQQEIVHLTGAVRYAQVENDILPYVQTTNDAWVLYLYLNPLNPEVLNIPTDADFRQQQYVIPTSTFDQSVPFDQPIPSISYDSLQEIDKVSDFIGKQVNYTSKAGSTRTYTCLSAENGKMRLAHEAGGSFYVNYSTTDQNLNLQQKYQGFEGQKVLYTTKQGTTDIYQCTSSENGKMLLKNSRASFNVNWSTLESQKATVQSIQEDTQILVQTALIS